MVEEREIFDLKLLHKKLGEETIFTSLDPLLLLGTYHKLKWLLNIFQEKSSFNDWICYSIYAYKLLIIVPIPLSTTTCSAEGTDQQ